MGAKAKRLAKFKQSHPQCCLCGGEVPTETIEHAPPKAMFFGSIRPKGLEVPACERCNSGSSQQDQVAALLACSQSPVLTSGSDGKPDEFKHFKKLVNGAGNNSEIGPMFDLAPDKFVMARGIIQPFKQLKIKPAAFSHYLYPWAAKQALAMWYERTNTIFGVNGSVTILWMDPKTVNQSGQVQNFLNGLPIIGGLAQGKLNVDEQFFYKVGVTDDQSMAVYWPVFHQRLTFVALLDTDADRARKLDTKGFKTSAILRVSRDKGIFIESMSSFHDDLRGRLVDSG